MKRWTWVVVAAMGLAVVGAYGLAMHVGLMNFTADHDGHAGMRPVDAGPEEAKNQPAPTTGMIAPHVVTFRNLAVVHHPVGQSMQRPGKKDRASGEGDEKRERSQLTQAQADALRAQALQQPVRRARVQKLRDITRNQRQPGVATPASTDVVNLLNGFDGPDISQCCGSSAEVPPDPHMTVGLNHVIAVVNSAIGIYDKQGQLLNGPVTSDSLFSGISGQCHGTFDPTVEYDEGANRFIINYDGSPNDCIAVSQTGDPTGAWNVYAFGTGAISANGDLFDYPHIGVGDQAIYVGANMFLSTGFAGRVWALDKTAMYAGNPLTAPTPHNLLDGGNADGTPTPMVLHGSPSAAGTVFIVTDDPSFDGNEFGIWKWTDPTGVAAPTLVGYADLLTATGVNAFYPVDQPQLGTPVQIQGNDWRSLDAEWRNGHLWITHQMSCDIGAGPLGCARWAEVDPTNASVVQAGVVSILGKSVSFPNLAVDANDNMALGFTVTGESKYASVYIAARMASDPPNTLRDAQEVKRGNTIYSAFDGSPGRWGDYSGMTADPDGQHLWYLGEYAKADLTPPYVPNQYGNWGTYIQQIGFGPDDHLFAGGFDPLRASLEVHAEINGDDADSAPGVSLLVGDPVQFRYVVINTGQQTLNNVVVTDDQLGVITCPTDTLAAGEDMICNVDGGGAQAGQYTNNANVTALAADGTAVGGADSANYFGFNPLVGTKCSTSGGANCSIAIPDNTPAGVSSTFTVSGCNTIDDVNVGLSIDHTWVGDLIVTVKSPGATSVTIVNRPGVPASTYGCGGDNIRAVLDDEGAGGPVENACATTVPTIFGAFTPNSSLTVFDNTTGNGTWTLKVSDNVAGDIGTLNDWSLQLTCH
ncbi:MAG: proprotein convertase P-domain-containing protein [Rudaea sp.]